MAQVTGKKVATTPMPTPTGTSGAIIDSFNTQDDKTVNAPSIHIVKDALTTINDNLDHAVYDLNLANKTTIVNQNTSFPYTYTPTTDGMLICQRLLGTSSSIANVIKINDVNVAVASSGYSYSMTIPVRHGDTIVFDYLSTASRVYFCPRVTS